MQHQDIPAFPEGEPATNGIYVSDGYGIAIKVRHRHLVVTDGIGSHRREQRFHKATSGLRRLVVLGHTGYITFEALRWMTDSKVGYLQLDRDGTILATTGALGVGKAELRRAQVQAAINQQGIELTRWILRHKLDGQADVVSSLSPSGKRRDSRPLRRPRLRRGSQWTPTHRIACRPQLLGAVGRPPRRIRDQG